MAKNKQSKSLPSSNWLALQKEISKPNTQASGSKASVSAFVARKRRKLAHTPESSSASVQTRHTAAESHTFPREASTEAANSVAERDEVKNGESLSQLRRLVFGEVEHVGSHTQPGKYLALDCEMVGVGIDGAESALARVSLVNYYGFIVLDVFVRPRERVVDYRTEFSGIRPSDMVHARPFEEVQKEVADLLKDRILVGHAVHNDLKALLLSHPRPQTRDTQMLAHKHKVSRGRRPALRHLTKQELGLTIQGGEHSSVTDARATMALFRLHRKTWEKDARPPPMPHSKSRGTTTPSANVAHKRPRTSSLSEPADHPSNDNDDGGGEADTHASPAVVREGRNNGKAKTPESFPGGGRRGVSSGLSTVVKRAGVPSSSKTKGKTRPKEKWWKDLGGGANSGSKGTLRLKRVDRSTIRPKLQEAHKTTRQSGEFQIGQVIIHASQS